MEKSKLADVISAFAIADAEIEEPQVVGGKDDTGIDV